MARFYVTAQGGRGETSRTGTVNSGASAHARGWGLGGRVHALDSGGQDSVTFQLTSGSNGRRRLPIVDVSARVTDQDNVTVVINVGEERVDFNILPEGKVVRA